MRNVGANARSLTLDRRFTPFDIKRAFAQTPAPASETPTVGEIFLFREESFFFRRRGNSGAVSGVFNGIGHHRLRNQTTQIDMKTKFTTLLGAVIIASLTGCASNPYSPSAAGAV